MTNTLVRIGNFLFHHRNRIFPVFMVGGVLTFRPSFFRDSYAADLWLDLAGLAVCMAGQALRVTTIGFDYIRRGGKNQQIWADKLVQGGMFAHSRNPLYLGNILMFVGIVMILHSPVAYLVGIPLVLFTYICIIFAEEQFLGGKFGADYVEYCGRVNRLWPDLRGFKESIKDMEFNWRRVILKEYGTTFAWIVAAIAIRAWCLHREEQAGALPEIYALLATLVPVFATYLIVRYLKISRRLQDTPREPADVPIPAAK